MPDFDSFPTRDIGIYDPSVQGTIDITISTESAEKALFDSKGQYINDKARAFDHKIFFFVPDDMIEDDSSMLKDYVEKNAF